MTYFISYAQNCEDVLLWRALQAKVPEGVGFYVDLGAADPEHDSVTFAFYERGWHGLNVEPNPESFKRLQAQRPRDTNIQAVVDIKEGVGTLEIVKEDYRLSTASQEIADEQSRNGLTTMSCTVEAVTLAALCDKYAPSDIHFLKIDVEGAEKQALLGGDFTKWRPWIVVVEAIHPISLSPTHVIWENILTEAHYHFAFFDGLNRFYVADERGADLDAAFGAPANVSDAFVRSDEAVRMNLKQVESTHEKVVRDLYQEIAIEKDAAAKTRAANIQLRESEDRAARERDAHAARLAEAEARVETLSSDCGRQASMIAATAAERDGWMQEMFETNRHLAYLAQERQKLLEECGIHQGERQRLTSQLGEMDGRIREQESRHRQHIEAIRTSTSWRLTGPLRVFRRALSNWVK